MTGVDTAHPTDGVLVALLDRQLVDDDAMQHVASCARCSARLDALRRTSQDFSRLLDAAPVAPVARARVAPHVEARVPARRVGRWSGAIAAGAALIMAGSAVAAIVATRRAAAREREAIERTAAREVRATASTPRPTATTTVSFTTVGDRLELRFDATQDSGTVALQLTDGALASAQVTGDVSEEMIVLPGSLRVRNRATSRASYRVIVPRRVGEITVVVAGRVQRIEARELPRTLSLSAR